MRHFIFIIYLLITTLSASAQSVAKISVSSLQSLSLDSNTNWVQKAFDNKITNDIQFVGLGEFTHGGLETILFKSKMIQYLIEQKGYRKLLLEYPNVILNPLNNYLIHKTSANADSTRIIARNIFGRTFLGNTVFYDLLAWLKKYNLQHPEDMINVQGFDIEGASDAFAGYFMNNFLLPADQSSALAIQSKWNNAPKDSVVIAELKWFYQHKANLLQPPGEELYYNIKATEDQLKHKLLQKRNVYKASEFRDSIMAANIIAATNNKKAIVWAHNIHITTADYVISLGNYLRTAVGKKYFTVLTDFSQKATVWLISYKGELLKKTFTPDTKATAYKLDKKFGVQDGVIFYDDLKKKNIPILINDIGRAGEQGAYGKGHPFDALVIFNSVDPFVFN